MSNFKVFSKKIGPTKLARFLNVTPEMVFKSNRLGYAPSDWFHRLVSIGKGSISYEDLYTDLYLNKMHCKPQVVKEQVRIFLDSHQISIDS